MPGEHSGSADDQISSILSQLAAGGGSAAPGSPLVWLGQQRYRTSGLRADGSDRAGGDRQWGVKDKTTTVDEAASSWYQWSTDPKKLKDWGDKLYHLGLIQTPNDYGAMQSIWNKAVQEAGNYYTVAGRKISPYQMPELFAGANGGRASGPKTTTATEYNIPTKAQAAANARQVWQQRLGRDPTSAELSALTSLITGAARKNPGVTRQTVDAKGNQTVTHTGGFSDADQGELLSAKAQADPEFGAYQSATYYFGALQNALSAPSNIGAH